mmetsp:Transcript_46746/g.111172  ORF Transcript_46746/g.111172 Transcript_46746/m.111172 type:complete len:558 (-) Transcript_46746:57-1730(-)
MQPNGARETAALAQLVANKGPWHLLWLAAHWEKKLKKEDHVKADVPELLRQIVGRLAKVVNLRAAGHLLLGACKIFNRKCQQLLDDVCEMQLKLVMVFGSAHQAIAPPDAEGAPKAKRRSRPRGSLGVARGASLEEADPALGEGALLRGQKFIARLEDITLREKRPHEALDAPDRSGPEDDVFGAVTGSELQAAMSELLNRLPDVPDPAALEAAMSDDEWDTQPLVTADGAIRIPRPAPVAHNKGHEEMADKPADPGVQEHKKEEGDDEQNPNVPDTVPQVPPPPLAGLQGPEGMERLASNLLQLAASDDEGAEVAEAEEAFGTVSEPEAKRRRKTPGFIIDAVTQIPSEVYRAHIANRSAITRLPKDCLAAQTEGSQLLVAAPAGNPVSEQHGSRGKQAGASSLVGDQPATERGVQQVSAEVRPASPARAAVFAAAEQRPAPEVSDPAAEELPVPMSMREVCMVLQREGEEESDGTSTGYSGRTERMKQFLSREFRKTASRPLSYTSLCQSGAAGKPDLIAACFFELLVLRTNGDVGLQQETPNADIRISRPIPFC